MANHRIAELLTSHEPQFFSMLRSIDSNEWNGKGTRVVLFSDLESVQIDVPSRVRAYYAEKENNGTQEFISGDERVILTRAILKGTHADDLENVRVLGGTLGKALMEGPDKEVLLDSALEEPFALAFAEGFVLGSYRFMKYFSEQKAPKRAVESLSLLNDQLSEGGLKETQLLCETVIATRDLVNETNFVQTATALAKSIEELGKKYGFSTEVLSKQRIESLKMGGLLAVNKGSLEPPSFTIMEWKPDNAVNEKPYVLVGKGIVYDTGGLSLKPTKGSMDSMKCDMHGAASVVGSMCSIAGAELPVHVVALVPSTDNRPGGSAYAPGDVITMFDGTTVEVLNTDAEGRLILADALSYAKRYKPELVIDMATLTGAAARAIGKHAIVGMQAKAQEPIRDLQKVGEQAGERVVEFPFWDEYAEYLVSTVADMKNIGGPEAGMITAGKFLEHFTDYPYIHLDIAGPSWMDSDYKYYPAGGAGIGVRLMYNFFKGLGK